MKEIVFMKTGSKTPGGLEKYTRLLIEAFVKKGYRATFLTSGSPPLFTQDVTIVSFGFPSPISLYNLISFNQKCQSWLKAHRPDIVFGMERTTWQTHYRAGNGVHKIYLERRKLIDSHFKKWSMPLNPLHRVLLSMEKKAFESPDLKVLFTNSKMVRQEILNSYQIDPSKLEVIHNGVEWEQWASYFESSFSRKEGPYHFLFVGNGYKRKGLHLLLKGLALIKKRDFKLTVVGQERNLADFIKLSKKLGIFKKVSFMGAQSNITPFYQAADALVLPSIYDPFANVTVEALAMGLYVITSNFNGGKEVIADGAGAIIEDLLSAESMACSLEKAFEKPKIEKRARTIRESIKHLDFSFQLDKIVQCTF